MWMSFERNIITGFERAPNKCRTLSAAAARYELTLLIPTGSENVFFLISIFHIPRPIISLSKKS